MVVAAHVHSSWSYDGNWTLAEIAAAFSSFGFDAVLMAEHDRTFTEKRWHEYCDECAACSRGVVLVPGLEYADPDDVVHVTVWGTRAFFGSGIPTAQLVAAGRAEGAVMVLAHPTRRAAHEIVDESWLSQLDGVELWNRRYDGTSPSDAAPELLRRSAGGIGVFAADFHSVSDLRPLAMAIDAHDATPDAIVDAFRERRARGVVRRVPGEALRRLVLGGAHKAHVLERLARHTKVRPA